MNRTVLILAALVICVLSLCYCDNDDESFGALVTDNDVRAQLLRLSPRVSTVKISTNGKRRIIEFVGPRGDVVDTVSIANSVDLKATKITAEKIGVPVVTAEKPWTFKNVPLFIF